MTQIGISYRIFQNVLDQSSPNFKGATLLTLIIINVGPVQKKIDRQSGTDPIQNQYQDQ